MKVLLTNIHSVHNAGDYALMTQSIHLIKEIYTVDIEIILCMDDLSYDNQAYEKVLSFTGWVLETNPDGSTKFNISKFISLIFSAFIPLWMYRFFKILPLWLTPQKLIPLLKAYTHVDAVYSVAGGYLYSSGRGVALLLRLFPLWLAHLTRKPCFLLPQSIGPIRKSSECRLLNYVLSSTRIVLPREPISLRQLELCRIDKPQIKLTPDLGFKFKGCTQSELDAWCTQNDLSLPSSSPALGLTVIDWGAQFSHFTHQSTYEEACAEAVRTFINQTGGTVYIFPQVCGPTKSQDDRIPSRRVANLVGSPVTAVYLIDKPVPAEVLKSLYGKMTIFIGTRMHSNIFALSQSVPTLAIGYLHKTRGIMEMLNLEQWVLDINSLSSHQLCSVMINLFEQRAFISKQIRSQLIEFDKMYAESTALLSADIYMHDAMRAQESAHHDS